MNRKELEQCAWDATPQDERRDRVEHRVGAKYRDHKRISEPKQRLRKLTGNNREIRVFDPSGSTPGTMSPWMPLWALYNDELMQRCEQSVEPKLRKPYQRTRRDYRSSLENGGGATQHATKKSPAQLEREIVEALAGKGASRGRHHSSISDSDKIRDAIARFPSAFGLRGFPGGVFRISPTSSYVSGGRVMLYTERKDNDDWLDFSKGTESELRSEVTSLASTGGRAHSTKSNQAAVTLTADQLAALRTFAKANGRTWKSSLNTAWSTGRYNDYNGTEEYGLLQQVRNAFGPSWLHKFSFDNIRTHSRQ